MSILNFMFSDSKPRKKIMNQKRLQAFFEISLLVCAMFRYTVDS